MSHIVIRILISAGVFAAFCLAGYMASSVQFVSDSILASTAVFGTSFVSMVGGAAKIWYDLFQ